MLQRGVIEPCDGPWASPIVLVSKKDGLTRFCVDYCHLNDVTKKDAYHLPRIQDNLDALRGSTYFSTLHLLSGFWQVAMDPADAGKTAFTVGGAGLYCFRTMPFGLSNAPATFEHLMEQTLAGLHWQIALLYIDDIIVYSDTVENHLQRLNLVLDRLRQVGLKLKPSKCELLRTSMEFLGHVVSTKGMAPDPKKVDKVLNWPKPTSLTNVRSFVGLCTYYRSYIPNFSQLAKPLYIMMEKNQPFVWGPEQKASMAALRDLPQPQY